ncbi:cytochrome P450 [Streptomyces sp. P9(2023)]|uniref:cytochrome P450 n=1 Tax=Streptomyces sp. P9(2023) TaxID=3064394 RepID=UPI0028F43D51|nr:cytochrome P450 [Streptomyces sp. P9(2023)]MDT9690023.1 cytochrome P450 [Streptomyces sp. P9(2023)]
MDPTSEGDQDQEHQHREHQHREHQRLDALQGDPYPLYARARQTDGLTFVPELDAWLVARDADVREVLLRPEGFSSTHALRPDILPTPAVFGVLARGFGGRPTVVSTDGAAHRRHRAPINSGLSAARVAALTPYATEVATALVDGFADDGHTELMASYAGRLPGAVIGRLIGFAPEDVPAAVHGGHRAEQLLFRPMDEDEQLAAAEDVVALQHLLERYARDRRAHPRDDLCSAMVAALAPAAAPGTTPDLAPDLTSDQRAELVANLQNFLIAGHLTTTALIGTAVLHLLRHRDQWELLCSRPDLIPGAVEEAVRYDTAVQGFRRTTTRQLVLAGTELPAGATVFVAYGSANRDAARHRDADTFDITRPASPTRHVGFGHGTHGCPGSQLARTQLQLTLELFTRRFPGLRPAEDREVVMRPTLIHRSPQELPLVW